MTIGGLSLSFSHLFSTPCLTGRKAPSPLSAPYCITRMSLQIDRGIDSHSATDLTTAIAKLNNETTSGALPGQGAEIARLSLCRLPDPAGSLPVNRRGLTVMPTTDRVVQLGTPDPTLARNGLMARANEVLIPVKAL
jgi:hypothetical protein